MTPHRQARVETVLPRQLVGLTELPMSCTSIQYMTTYVDTYTVGRSAAVAPRGAGDARNQKYRGNDIPRYFIKCIKHLLQYVHGWLISVQRNIHYKHIGAISCR